MKKMILSMTIVCTCLIVGVGCSSNIENNNLEKYPITILEGNWEFKINYWKYISQISFTPQVVTPDNGTKFLAINITAKNLSTNPDNLYWYIEDDIFYVYKNYNDKGELVDWFRGPYAANNETPENGLKNNFLPNEISTGFIYFIIPESHHAEDNKLFLNIVNGPQNKYVNLKNIPF